MITQDFENGTAIVEIEASILEIHQSVTPSVPNFDGARTLMYVFHETEYEFGGINLLIDRQHMLTPMHIFMEVSQVNKLVNDIPSKRK